MCAKPVRPGTSFLDPTWYHTATATVGVDRSGARMTLSPLGRVYVSCAMRMTSAGRPCGRCAGGEAAEPIGKRVRLVRDANDIGGAPLRPLCGEGRSDHERARHGGAGKEESNRSHGCGG